MRKIIGLGESVLDIVFKEQQPKSANPGGSAFNAIIAIGRCGLPCCFLTEMGDDLVADFSMDFMQKNGVDTRFVTRIPATKSRISLAFLDEANEAKYQFYRDPEPGNLQYVMPEIGEGDLVLISSFYAVNPAIRYRVAPFLRKAREAGAIIYYDVNFRPSHAADIPAVLDAVKENLELAHIVRGSLDDFKVLYGESDADTIYTQLVSPYCKNLILTNGAEPVCIFTPNGKTEYPVQPIQTVSTIGAGDNFNAGVLYSIYKKEIYRGQLAGLSDDIWKEIYDTAQSFSREVCQSMENYVSQAFGLQMR